jgi:CBS domain containing-hemolysin-like protein
VTPWLLLGVGALLIAGNALFVAAETALVTVERTEVDAAAAAVTPAPAGCAARCPSCRRSCPRRSWGSPSPRWRSGWWPSRRSPPLLHGPLTATGLPEGAVEPVAIAIGLLMASVVQMVLGELVPKNLALARPFATATAVLPLQLGFAAASRPLVAVLNGTANRLLRAVGWSRPRSCAAPALRRAVPGAAPVRARGALANETAQLLVRSLTSATSARRT